MVQRSSATGQGVSDIRVGLVGYGLAGSAFHAPFIVTTPGLRLAAVLTRDPGRRANAERDHPGVRLVSSPGELFDPALVDLVVIASPNRTHVPLALEAIRAGLPVIVDKPLAPSVAAARSLVDEAQRRGGKLTVFQNRRWDGDVLTIRRLIADGALGDVFRFESRFERWRPVPKPGWREAGDPEEAGGLLFDLGSHLIDQALQLFGPVTSVCAELDRRRPGVEVEDDVFVALTHASGVRSHLWMSAVAAQLGPRFRVLGSRAAYVKYGLDVQEAALLAGRRPREDGWGEEPPDRWGTVGAGETLERVRTERGHYGRFYEAVVPWVRGSAGPPVDPADAIAVLDIIERARSVSALHPADADAVVPASTRDPHRPD